ncbi:lysylphosphatidylglycerol synthase domain-containing protein [Pseudokineococcus basanitobsidens]|uniref:Lysylphosphatidylglycerol synthase domain-containing protein n=1 Tax=Pseudokineococcus basanitobsidens TaxID=1926649 RepID=A0ABU8RH26_9ACTN
MADRRHRAAAPPAPPPAGEPGTPEQPGRSAARRRWGAAWRTAAALLLLGAVVLVVGGEPFREGARVLAPWPVVAALGLGTTATAAQSMRWRAVLRGYPGAAAMTRTRAFAEYLRAQALDVLLPSGVAGSVTRAVRGRGAAQGGLRASAAAVLGERATGFALVLAAGALAVAPVHRVGGALLGAAALVSAGVAVPALRRVDGRTRLAVVGWSVLAVVPLLLLFSVAATEVLDGLGAGQVVALAVAALAGMAVPVSVGGFGPREVVTGATAAGTGLAASDGVAAAVAYGLLVAVSAVPGVLLLLRDVVRGGRGSPGRGDDPGRADASGRAPAADG